MIAGGVLCMCIAYIGLGIKRYYLVRKQVYGDLLLFIELLTNNITYLKSPLPQLISEFVGGKKGDVVKLLTDYAAVIECGNYSKIDSMKISVMRQAEMQNIKAFLKDLGKYDSATQLNNLSSWQSRFAQSDKDATAKAATYGTLAFKLGVLLGILAMIIIA